MTTWLVSKSGSNTYGGTGTSVLATATDGVTSSANSNLTSVSGLFTSGMVGQGICINGTLRIITAFNSSSSITYSGATLGTHTGYTWTIGGPWLTINTALVTANAVAAGDQIYIGSGVYRETVANARSGSQLSTTYNGANGSSLTTLGSVITLTSVSGLVQPPAGYYNQGSVVTSAGVVGFTWTGISGSTLTGVTFLTNNTVTSAATVASSATLIVSIPVWVIGDVDGAQTGLAGQVTMSAYTTNDTTAASSTVELALAATTNVSFALLTIIGGGSATVASTPPSAINFYTFIDCTINALTVASATAVNLNSSTTGLAMCVLIDRCTIIEGVGGNAVVSFAVATTTSGSGDFDLLSVIRNTQIFGGSISARVTSSGTSANKPGGARAFNCSFFGAATGMETTPASEVSTSIPCEIHNSFVVSTTALDALTSGQLVEDHNFLIATTPRTNVTAGTGSQTTAYAPLLELGQSFKWAMGTVRPFLAPDGPSSPLLGFGNAAGSPTYDWANRPRPSGGGSASAAVGYSEFHDFGIQDTVTFPSGQTSSAKLIGPGDNDIWVPVDAVSTTIAIQLRQGSGYTGTTYATATILGQGELGIASQIVTCSSTLSAWQTLTFSAISASKAGWVKVRITSFDTSGTGVLNFGALTAT